MTSLSDLQNAMTAAMKAKDRQRTATLRLAVSAVRQKEIDSRQSATDDDVAEILRRQVKQRREAAEQYRAGNREQQAADEEAEAEILASYLPTEMTAEELETAIRAILSETEERGPAAVGRVMKELMIRHRNQIDGRRAQQVVRQLLST